MGNTSSHSSNTGTGTPGRGPSGSFSTPGGPSAPTNIPVNVNGQSSHAGAFHSGLTPPITPPSPEPPGTPLLLPYAGHLSPQNPHALSHPQAHDYSKRVVTALILDNQLAPFYRGLEDWEDDWGEEDVGRVLSEIREKDYKDAVDNSYTSRLKKDREPESAQSDAASSLKKTAIIHDIIVTGSLEDKEEHDRRERKAYLGAVECPICFLSYPPNINTSRCCQQPLCTECFVQIKRGEATLTHLDSEPACCPYCMETDFGVIYERPTPPSVSATPVGPSDSSIALSTSPELATSPDGYMSGFSQALSLNSEDAELSVGPGMAPKAQETARRKSVSSKAKEVVTIDQIRPDWENKLNSVKAAAARRASRRIVMRQVGDRLIPIGFTSARATGQADFSMSIPQTEEGTGRRARRGRERERELEELMIEEAMRLSLLDHEEYQRKMIERPTGTGSSTPVGDSSRRSSAAGASLSSWRATNSTEASGKSTASKLLSKISGNRSRANSKSSVHFAPSPTTLGPPGSPRTASGSNSPLPRARSSSTPSPGLTPAASSSSLRTSALAAPVPTRAGPSLTVPVAGRRSLDMPRLSAIEPLPPIRPASAQAISPIAEPVSEIPDAPAVPAPDATPN